MHSSTCIILCGGYNSQKTTIRDFLHQYLASQGLVEGEQLVLSTHQQVVQGMFGHQDTAGLWRDGVVASRLMVSQGKPLCITLDGTFDSTVWAYVTRITNTDFPIILPSGKKVALPPGSKIFIEVPDYAAMQPRFLKDFCIQRLESSHLGQHDVLRHLFLTFYDSDVYDRVKDICHNYLRIFQEFLASHCSPLIPLEFTQSETNFFNLFDSLIKSFFPESDLWKTNTALLKKMGLFCSVWAVFPSVNKENQVNLPPQNVF